MVLESIITPESAKKKPLDVLLISVLITFVAFIITANIFSTSLRAEGVYSVGGGFLTVAFISLATAPFFVNLLRVEAEEEWEDSRLKRKYPFFARHWDVFITYSMLFIGVVIAVSAISSFVPEEILNVVFGDQLREIFNIQSQDLTGRIADPGMARIVFENNIKVIWVTFVFSFLFGAGAVFIIAWNASIIGVLIGTFVREQVKAGANSFFAYLTSLPLSAVALLPHGIFEIGAYFVAGMAGGILSASIARRKFFGSEERIIWCDVLKLMLFSIVLVSMGAIIESIY